MDDLFGFLFMAFIVLGVIYLVSMFVTTVLVNLYVLLDPVLAGFSALPAPLAWGLTSAVFVGLLHFACAESPRLRRPVFGRVATAAAVGWLAVVGLFGLTLDPASAPVSYARQQKPVPPPVTPPPRYIPPPSPPSPPPRQPRRDANLHETAYVDTQKLNVRAGPGSNFSVVDTVGDGALVRILERRQASDGRPWVRIRAGAAEGWVSEPYLRSPGKPKAERRTPPSASPNTTPDASKARAEPRPDSSLPIVQPSPGSSLRRPGKPYPATNVSARQLNVRQGPGTGYPLVARLASGALVRMTARQWGADGDPWLHIRAGSTEGWVSERELHIPEPTAKTRKPQIDASPTPGSWARVATTLLNVRAGPGVDNGVVGRIARGTRVRVSERRRVEDDAIWARIQSDALRGWVNAKFLETVR